MTTSTARSVGLLLIAVALALASTGVVSGQTITASPSEAPVVRPGPQVSARTKQVRASKPRSRPQADPSPYSYGWPVKPFDRQHPVRGFFGDPRIANHGQSRQFHFGVDISAPNGTAVYATLPGTAYIHPQHSTTVTIVGRGDVEFSYWHIEPTVRSGETVVAYETVIGRIEKPYGHVHFSEKRNGRYLNPLRRGAMGPFVDDTRPVVRSLVVVDGAEPALVAEAYDETPVAIPRPWHDLPVMPAVVSWRLLDEDGRTVVDWKTVVDFRQTIPSAFQFDEVWASGATQNHVRTPGRYRLIVTRTSAFSALRPGAYTIEVAAVDTRANAGHARFRFDVSRSRRSAVGPLAASARSSR